VGDVRIGQRRTIEARLLLSTVILSDSKRKLVARIGWSKCGERNAKKPDAFRDRELGFEQIQADPLQCGSFFDYPGQRPAASDLLEIRNGAVCHIDGHAKVTTPGRYRPH
jgi:hypothetical protein